MLFETNKRILNMNERAFVTILLCFHTARCKLTAIMDIAVFSYEIITLGDDVIDRIRSGDNNEKLQESINDLQKSMDQLHKKLDDNSQQLKKLNCKIDEVPHKTTILLNIEEIENCIADLKNVLNTPSDMEVRENFEKCYDIKKNVRGIGKYLTHSGESTIDDRTIYELTCDEDGLYKGQNTERRFNYLLGHFMDGCTVMVIVEGLKSENRSTALRDDCWDDIGKIISSKSTYYQNSIDQSCSTFYAQAYELLNRLEAINVLTIHDVLRRNLPWFQYTVVESKVPDSAVKNKGDFPLKYKKFIVKQKVYHVFWTDSFVSFYKNRSNENQHFVNVTVSFDDYEDLSFGMNLSEDTSRERKLVSVFGYTSDQSIINCTYSQGPDASTAASSTENLLPTTTLILVVMLFCPAIINMDLRIGMHL